MKGGILLIVISDENDKNWGLFVYDNGLERTIYTRIIEYEGIAPRSVNISSFNGSYRILVGLDGTIYTFRN